MSIRRIIARVHPGAREEFVEDMGNSTYRVSVREQAERGAANRAVLHAIANHFHVPLAQVILKAGHASHTKIIEVW